MTPKFLKDLMFQEQLELLKRCGFGPLVQVLHEEKIYFRSGRLNMSALSKRLNCNPAQTLKLLAAAREVLEPTPVENDETKTP